MHVPDMAVCADATGMVLFTHGAGTALRVSTPSDRPSGQTRWVGRCVGKTIDECTVRHLVGEGLAGDRLETEPRGGVSKAC